MQGRLAGAVSWEASGLTGIRSMSGTNDGHPSGMDIRLKRGNRIERDTENPALS